MLNFDRDVSLRKRGGSQATFRRYRATRGQNPRAEP